MEMSNFENPTWHTATISKNHYISISQPQIVQILTQPMKHANINLKSIYLHISAAKCRNFTKLSTQTQLLSQAMETWQKKSEIIKFKMADERYIENHIFAYISAPYWPINVKFGTEMKDHMPIYVTWPKLQFSKIQHGGRPPFWKQFSVFTSFL